MSRAILVFIALTFVCFAASAQEGGEAGLLRRLDAINAASSPSPSATPETKTADSAAQKPPTEITATKEATYDEKTRKAVFTGDVHVNDPQFKITCDKLTAFLREQAASGKAAASPSPRPAASPKPSPGKTASPNGGGGLQRAIAEGNVIIIQDKPGVDGNPPQHNVGKCQHADFDADSGDVTLSGWPQVQQGINTQIATEQSTIMIMNRDGRTMRTKGASKTVIQDQSDSSAKTR